MGKEMGMEMGKGIGMGMGSERESGGNGMRQSQQTVINIPNLILEANKFKLKDMEKNRSDITASLRALKILAIVEYLLAKKVQEEGYESLLNDDNIDLAFTFKDLKENFPPHLWNILRGAFYSATKYLQLTTYYWLIKDAETIRNWVEKNYDEGTPEREVAEKIIRRYCSEKVRGVIFAPVIDIVFEDGALRITVHKLLKLFFLSKPKREFTKLPLTVVLKFRKKNAFKLYEKLKRFSTLGKRTIPVEELYAMFDLAVFDKKETALIPKTDKYDWGIVKRNYLEPAVEEINRVSDITVSFKEVKKGKKVVRVNFFIVPKTDTVPSNEIETNDIEPKHGEYFENILKEHSPVETEKKAEEGKTEEGRKQKSESETFKNLYKLVSKVAKKKGFKGKEKNLKENLKEACRLYGEVYDEIGKQIGGDYRYPSVRTYILHDLLVDYKIPVGYLIALSEAGALERIAEMLEDFENERIKSLKAYLAGVLKNDYGLNPAEIEKKTEKLDKYIRFVAKVAKAFYEAKTRK